jgi:small neutral amino acid transporter SnatA (MarC family)
MASFLYRVLGRGGIEIISRVFGLVALITALDYWTGATTSDPKWIRLSA